MAKVIAQAIGGQLQEIEANTVGELKQKMELASYQATVNGEPQEDDYELSEFEVVNLAPKVKGA